MHETGPALNQLSTNGAPTILYMARIMSGTQHYRAGQAAQIMPSTKLVLQEIGPAPNITGPLLLVAAKVQVQRALRKS